MQCSVIPGNLFLKLPATILQISPKASKVSSVVSGRSIPNIFEAIKFAALDEQRKTQTPRSLPARPTIAVNSQVATSVCGGADVAMLLSIAEKTSHAASRNSSGQFSRVRSSCSGTATCWGITICKGTTTSGLFASGRSVLPRSVLEKSSWLTARLSAGKRQGLSHDAICPRGWFVLDT